MSLPVIEAQIIDHEWVWWKAAKKYLCPICGALTRIKPPHPTPDGWMPEKYIPLNPELRALAPKH